MTDETALAIAVVLDWMRSIGCHALAGTLEALAVSALRKWGVG